MLKFDSLTQTFLQKVLMFGNAYIGYILPRHITFNKSRLLVDTLSQLYLLHP